MPETVPLATGLRVEFERLVEDAGAVLDNFVFEVLALEQRRTGHVVRETEKKKPEC